VTVLFSVVFGIGIVGDGAFFSVTVALDDFDVRDRLVQERLLFRIAVGINHDCNTIG